MTDIPKFLQMNFSAEIGSHHFNVDEIHAFAEQFAPFDMHTRAERPQVVNLHIASVWMSLQRTFIADSTKKLMNSGETYPVFGPSPGVDYMKWPNPVFAGDTVHYQNNIIDNRPSSSRPGWYIMTNRVIGKNQDGVEVMDFQSSVLITLKT